MVGFLISVALGAAVGLAMSRTEAGKKLICWTLERWETLEGRKHVSSIRQFGKEWARWPGNTPTRSPRSSTKPSKAGFV
jgi:hypothetical protein